MSKQRTARVAIPSTMRLSAEMRRIKAAAEAQGISIDELSDAQAILHEMFPEARTMLKAYTATKDVSTCSVLYMLTYVTGEVDQDTFILETIHRETREVIISDNLSASSDTITYSQG